MTLNKGKMIGGIALMAEGTALAVYGPRYLDFMERHGLMDLGKRMLRAAGIRSTKALTTIGIIEATIGLMLLRNARSQQAFA
jgi:hypothetical protein